MSPKPSIANPVPAFAIPLPPSRVENKSWAALLTVIDESSSDANAVIGTATNPPKRSPVLLFVVWHALAISPPRVTARATARDTD
jgi:hypothetical protein